MAWTPKERLAARRKALREAKTDLQKAIQKQERLEKDARKKASAKERARLEVERLKGVVRAKRKLVEQQEKVVGKRAPKLKPERTKIGNHSSRNGVKPKLIVLHITVSHNRPGLGDIDAILNYFDQPSSGASSHIVNDREGHDARCVYDRDKAWTCAAYNSLSLNIEQIEYSSARTRQQWLSESRKQLDNTALWIAYWSKKYDIPITHSTRHGVCQHFELGAAGGGHSDCGPGYPMDYVLRKAREYRARM